MLTDEEMADIACRDVDLEGFMQELNDYYADAEQFDDAATMHICEDVIEMIKNNLM